MNWTNFAYAMVLVFTIMGTMVAQKYRIVVKELKEFSKAATDLLDSIAIPE